VTRGGKVTEKTEASVIIDRPVEEVWRFVTDVEKMVKFDPGVLEVKVTSRSGDYSHVEAFRWDLHVPLHRVPNQ
jgi:uncharacterized protein YndB with AHSA1/START domain